MLVLDRKANTSDGQDSFVIVTRDGDEILVKVLGIGRRRVKIGVRAHPDIVVVREELRGKLLPSDKKD